MIAKKNPKADLEKKRFAFFQIGLIVAGSLCLAAFEFSSVQSAPVAANGTDDQISNILIDEILTELPTQQKKKERVLDLSEEVIVTPEPVPDPTPEPDPDPTPDPGPIVIVEDGGEDQDGGGTFTPPPIIYDVPDVDPSFKGGQVEMGKFINKYINIPQYVMEKGGIVYIEFVVNKDGSIEQSRVVGTVSPELDKAALDVIAKMPKWIPGEQAGKSVRSRLTIPINIVLR